MGGHHWHWSGAGEKGIGERKSENSQGGSEEVIPNLAKGVCVIQNPCKEDMKLGRKKKPKLLG